MTLRRQPTDNPRKFPNLDGGMSIEHFSRLCEGFMVCCAITVCDSVNVTVLPKIIDSIKRHIAMPTSAAIGGCQYEGCLRLFDQLSQVGITLSQYLAGITIIAGRPLCGPGLPFSGPASIRFWVPILQHSLCLMPFCTTDNIPHSQGLHQFPACPQT
jgi:hypothetical protein